MQRRELSKLALATAVGSFFAEKPASAQSGGAPPYYPPTPQEVTAHITRFDLPPGDVRRYGAIAYPDPVPNSTFPTLISAQEGQQTQCSADAFERAIAYNSLVYVPPGHYLVTRSVEISKSGVTILGGGPGYSIGGVTLGGTSIRLRLASFVQSQTGSLARPTIFKWIVPARAIHIHGICFHTRSIGTETSPRRALAFSGLLGGSVSRCRFEGGSDAGDESIAIEFLASSPYTGAIDISENYFTNLRYGILMRNTCTTVRITNNEFYGNNPSDASVYAIFAEGQCSGMTITGNDIEGWQAGIRIEGSDVTQVANRFENNQQSWIWQRSPSNLPIYNTSLGDRVIPSVRFAGTPVYPSDDFNGCVVIRTRRFEFGASDNGLKLGNYRIWVDPSGKLRIKNGEPVNATDGTVVGAQS
jgi:hypothetical protein